MGYQAAKHRNESKNGSNLFFVEFVAVRCLKAHGHMFCITLFQLKKFQHQRVLDFVGRVQQDLTRRFPRKLGNLSDNPKYFCDVIQRWMVHAHERGFCTESQMRIYFEACVLLGTMAVEAPCDQTLTDLFNNTLLDGNRKAELLAQYLLFTSCMSDD